MDKYNIMRMFCMFDLPVETEEGKEEIIEYSEKNLFRKGLL